MNNYPFCPISYKKIDDNVARWNGFFTVLFLLIYLFTSSLLPVVFLILDFLARSLEKPSWSLFARISKGIVNGLKVKPKLINAGPKLFAARIGLFFSVTILITSLSGWTITSLVLAIVFGSFAFLEAGFGFCVACKVYPFLYKLTYQKPIDKVNFNSDFHI